MGYNYTGFRLIQQHCPQPPHPVRQGGQRQRDVLAGGDLRQAVQRQVVEEFAYQHPRQQAGGGYAAVDDGGRDRRGDDGFAGAAGVLRVSNSHFGGLTRFPASVGAVS